MNNKEVELNRILDIAISCCASESTRVSKEDILGRSRKEECVWVRTLAVSLLVRGGYLTSTIAKALNRTTPAIRHLIRLDGVLKYSSRAYRLACDEAMLQYRKDIAKRK